MWRETTGEMVVAYSINKEDIAITRFQLSILNDDNNDHSGSSRETRE